VGTIEPKPLITPSAAQVRQTIDLMRQQAVKVVICETYSDDKLAQYVADQAGAKMVRLPDHVMGVPQARTYQDLFRYDVDKLIETAESAGVRPTVQDSAKSAPGTRHEGIGAPQGVPARTVGPDGSQPH
jgi:hypothetical protein